MPSTAQQQYQIFCEALKGKTGLPRVGPLFRAVCDWLKLPLELTLDEQQNIQLLVCLAFGLTSIELRQELNKPPSVVPEPLQAQVSTQIFEVTHGTARTIQEHLVEKARQDEQDLVDLLPRSGYFRDYITYTVNSEAPLAYHIFCALAGMAATCNRRVFFDMGSFRIYPPLGILILGPSGIKKTSAADIILSILIEMQLTEVYAEKITPEALVDSMQKIATGLVYAPEMTVLVGKQKYMESLIPLLTRMMDSPDLLPTATMARGRVLLESVGITCLMCSTLDWFIKNTPQEVFGGGFIARNIMVIQQTSPRSLAFPPPSDKKLRQRLISELAQCHTLQGQMFKSKEMKDLHETWYHEDKRKRNSETELLETYYQRKHAHLLRFAMCMHLATCGNLEICGSCWTRCFKILNWIERFFPILTKDLFQTQQGEDQHYVLRYIQNVGTIDHSVLLRRVSNKYNADTMQKIIRTLKESGRVRETLTKIEHSYSYVDVEDRNA